MLCRYGPPKVWTRNNAAGIWDCLVEMPHSLAAAGPKAGEAGEACDVAAANGTPPAAGGSASKRPPLHPGAASGTTAGPAAASPAKAGAAGASIPRKRSVPSIPQHEDIEKQQPGVTAQADDSRLLGSPAAEAAMAAGMGAAAGEAPADQAEAANMWRSMLEEQLRCAELKPAKLLSCGQLDV